MTNKEDPNPYQNPGAGGPEEREATALERIADTLDNIAALLASQRVPAGSAHPAGKNGDDEGWIEWRGGECPVLSRFNVDAKFRRGYEAYDLSAQYLDWTHLNSRSDIIAYRIHRPQEGKTE